ncbi:GNAT family N-acetyltransferase [Marinactinospora thermotolerans]|uniref:N-acetylglutamate synthase and related acetyltransferases n=1 Tax=Marinactinospora thermotolerans DSM 45154 TaxID=1122192 RepID=A0A1T4PB37_9ACTN|nr:GNAT family N-acetyltransferase [Marinactinospora thermotolerans]SJZ88028.1 N-acetylglutamate synthase and related acetyltransferases [Marinactinospora thermotolerans DSM 45154]
MTRLRNAKDPAPSVTILPVAWDDPEAGALRQAQQREISARYGVADSEPGPKPSAADVTVMLVARAGDGTAVACGALRHLGGAVGEVKRMYVRPDRRGRGLSRLVLSALEERARGLGWEVLRLETGDAQHEAIGLYTASGYHPIPCYGPYADAPRSLCFERRL